MYSSSTSKKLYEGLYKEKYRCNICGNVDEIVYKSLIDGNVCRECKDTYFIEVDGDIKSKLYDKHMVMEFIVNDNNRVMYLNLVKAIKDIQQRYTSCIIDSCITNNNLRLVYRVQYKSKELLLIMLVGVDKTTYRIVLDGGELINRVFE